jgi:hypothetical protein
MILLISVSWVTRITDKSHWCLADVINFKISKCKGCTGSSEFVKCIKRVLIKGWQVLLLR